MRKAMTEKRIPVRIAVLTVSDTRDETTDKSGKVLVERLEEAGHVLHQKAILPDDIYRLRATIQQNPEERFVNFRIPREIDQKMQFS